MNTIRPGLVAAVVLVGLTGCPPPPSGPPSLFNAVDPSLQCPAGQIGWDFSTGGNDTGIKRNAVGDTIAITRADFGGSCQAGLADQFRANCDGYAFCTLDVPGCTDGDITLEYQCGTETATYRARTEQGDGGEQVTLACGSVLTVVNAIYAPDAEQPANITNALAGICTGKRRCSSGTSGYALNNSQDPQPNVAKKVQVTYVCDAQARERTVLVDDFKLDFYCDDSEVVPVEKLEFLAIQTVVPRSFKTELTSCPPDNPAKPWCPGVVEGAEQAYADWAAELYEGISEACEGRRDCEYDVRQLPSYEKDTAYRSILPEPDEVDVRGIPLGPADLNLTQQAYLVGYTCGSDPFINWKFVPIPVGVQYTPTLKLTCGQPVQVTDVYVGQGQYNAARRTELLERMQSSCDGKRVCYPPTVDGRAYDRYYDENGVKRFRSFQDLSSSVVVAYTCGDLDFARTYTREIDYSGRETHLECEPARDDVIARGIRIDSVSPASKTLEITKLCFGLDNCVLPAGQGEIAVAYRCGGSPTVQTHNYGGLGNSGRTIECRPSARFLERYFIDGNGVRVPLAGNVCQLDGHYDNWWVPPGGSFVPDHDGMGNYCPSGFRIPANTCPWNYAYDTDGDGNNDANIDLCTVNEYHWDFQCGADPSDIQTFSQVRGDPGWVNDSDYRMLYPRWIEGITCLPPLVPYVHKKCVQQNCYGQVRRGSELQCETDSSLIPRFSYAAPIVKNYESTADGEAAYWGGTEAVENGVTTLRSGHPYQIFPFITYQTPGGAYWPLPEGTDVTTWAYDVFRPVDANDAPAGAEVYGFRCLVNSTDMKPKYIDYPGYWRLFAGGSATTIPDSCYGHDIEKSNDPSTSWFEAAKRSNMTESQFEQKYQRVGTKLVVSLDPGARESVRWFSPYIYWAPNPIGFFYDPNRDFIDSMAFYGQTADFQNQKDVSFVESTEIVISAVRQSVSADRFHIDVNDPEYYPTIAVDFSWYLRGDNPKNPYSPDPQISGGDAQSLSRDNLRAVVEIAYADDTSTTWTPVSAARFSEEKPLRNHNVYLQTERFQFTISELMKVRMMTVRGTNATIGEKTNGWMATFDDEDTVFKVRACLVSDDFGFTLGANDAATPSQSTSGYSLRLAKRCSEPSTLILGRELYVTPEPVAAKTLAETEGASMGGSGDSETASTADNGTQTNCSRQCTADSDCGSGGTCSADGRCLETLGNQRCVSENRSGSGSTAGSVKMTLYANRTDNSKQTANNQTQSSTSNTTELMGFQVMDVNESSSNSAAGSYNFTLDIGLNLAPIIDAARGIKSTPKPPGWTIELNGKEPKDRATNIYGVQFIVSAEFRFAIGPFPMSIIFAFTVALVPHLTLQLAGGTFTGPNTDNPALSYPCFTSTSGNSKCYVREGTAKSFPDARDVCRSKGGRLATAYSATEASALYSAAGDGQHWIGAVPQYLYQYSPCADVGTPQATPIPAGVNCAERSRTRYTWLTANPTSTGTAFATQAGLGTTFTDTTALPSPLSMTAAPSYVTQGLAGVHYTKGTGKLGHAPRSTEKPFVCEYDPATAVVANLQDVSIAVEVMAAFSVEGCMPSGEFGVCIQGTVKFFTAEIRFGITLTRSDIYGTHPSTGTGNIPWSTLSGTNVYGKVSASALAVELAAVLRFYFWDKTIVIKKIDPPWSWERYLFQIPNNAYQSHLETP